MQNALMRLCDVPTGTLASVLGFTESINVGFMNRLLELGLTRGSPVRVTGLAPLGDPMMISVRGCQLAIRKNDAADIRVVTV
ncbi:MAG TPA: FeoA family protein [Methanocorpusculum sp.]|nr:FeoA family protein [Methanocorpusculum sp.]HJJ53846.1 FeoA family protein [Methanocorpusculum sp.]